MLFSAISSKILFFSLFTSDSVRVSALEITGTMLTLWCRAFMNSISSGFNLRWKQEMSRYPSKQVKEIDSIPNAFCHIPVSCRRYKIKAAMNSIVNDVSAIQTTFIVQIAFELLVNVLYDRLVTKTKDFEILHQIRLKDRWSVYLKSLEWSVAAQRQTSLLTEVKQINFHPTVAKKLMRIYKRNLYKLIWTLYS